MFFWSKLTTYNLFTYDAFAFGEAGVPASAESGMREKKKDLMSRIMDGRLSKQAKKAGVSVTVRSKK